MHNVVILMHHNDAGDSPEPQLLATTFGYTIYRIDLNGTMPIGPTVFKTLDDALEAPQFEGWHWVFFDPAAKDSLKTIGHQRTNVVYAFGQENDGWDRSLDQLPGALAHVPSELGQGFIHTSAISAEIVMSARYMEVEAK